MVRTWAINEPTNQPASHCLLAAPLKQNNSGLFIAGVLFSFQDLIHTEKVFKA